MEKDDILIRREFLKSNWASTDFNKSDMSKKIPFPSQQKPIKEGQEKIPLIPKENWQSFEVNLFDIIIQRKSTRKYLDEKISFEQLSKLLFCTQGIRKYYPDYSFRTVPSGGARHPFETYFYANKVENLEKGIYRYLPIDNCIVLEIPYYDGIERDIHKATLEQFWNPAIYFFWSVIPYRTEYKYLEAAAKLAAIDIGHVCQNLYLVAESFDCGVCAIAAYDQSAMDNLLKLDGKDEFVIYCASCGKKIRK
ncbi:MAG: SagB/ThcOx family dehydrogenase [Exilispira sp.]|jgi:SagB-type dehydrogenase family enzyme|nr:SagB/ThcOx family dehydrogenase [Exilispira sp.]